jgi:hypothetical protein
LTFICNDHVHLLPGADAGIKKPAKKSFRVLAGIGYKPKRLCATCLYLTTVIIYQSVLKSKKMSYFVAG